MNNRRFHSELLYKISKFELFTSASAEIRNNLDGLKTANFDLSFRLSRDYRQVYSFIQFVVNYH